MLKGNLEHLRLTGTLLEIIRMILTNSDCFTKKLIIMSINGIIVDKRT